MFGGGTRLAIAGCMNTQTASHAQSGSSASSSSSASSASSGAKWLFAFVLFDFLALHVYAIYADGLIDGFIAQLRSGNAWGLVLGVDLVIALSLIGGWLIRDAKREKVSPWPYVLMMPLAGSAGALLYLLRRRG